MIVTFYSESGDRSHTSVLAGTLSWLARWGYATLCVDWDFTGSALAASLAAARLHAGQNGLATLIADHVADRLPYSDRYVEHIDLTTGGRVDVLPAGRRGVRPMTHEEWAGLYQDGLADFLEECREKWRESYDLVVINGPAGNDGSRGIHLAHLPDLIVPVLSSSAADRTVETLRRVDAARDKLPYGSGRLVVVPMLLGSSDVVASFEPWLRTWVSRDLPVSAAITALTTHGTDDIGPVRLLAALLARDLAGTALIGTDPAGYVGVAAAAHVVRKPARRHFLTYRRTTVPRAWMAELARAAIERAAPQELRFFDLVAGAYLDNPARAIRKRPGLRDVPLGFGLETVVDTVTQAAVYISMRVLDATTDRGTRKDSRWWNVIRRSLRRSSAVDSQTLDEVALDLSEEKLRVARDVGLAACVEIGIAPATATLVVDAMMNRLRRPRQL